MRVMEPVEGLKTRHLAGKNDDGLGLLSEPPRITIRLRTSTRSNRTCRQQLNTKNQRRRRRAQSGPMQVVASILIWLQRCHRVVSHLERVVVLVIAAVVALLVEIALATALLAVKLVHAVAHAE